MKRMLNSEQINEFLQSLDTIEGAKKYVEGRKEFAKKLEKYDLLQDDIITQGTKDILFWLYQFLTLPTEEEITLNYQTLMDNIFDDNPMLFIKSNNFSIAIKKPMTLSDISKYQELLNNINADHYDDFALLFTAMGDLMQIQITTPLQTTIKIKNLDEVSIDDGKLLYNTSRLIFNIIQLYTASFNFIGKKKTIKLI